jgi:hypothetical protein
MPGEEGQPPITTSKGIAAGAQEQGHHLHAQEKGHHRNPGTRASWVLLGASSPPAPTSKATISAHEQGRHRSLGPRASPSAPSTARKCCQRPTTSRCRFPLPLFCQSVSRPITTGDLGWSRAPVDDVTVAITGKKNKKWYSWRTN